MPEIVSDPKNVFVVHGRNQAAKRAVSEFLRALGLDPIEWSYAIAATGIPTPYVGAVLDHAFRIAQAVVVLITGDDIARLGRCFVTDTDDSSEREFSRQARPNVLFEAGMAFGRMPERTILVAIGEFRPFSDIAGRHILHLNNSAPMRQSFVSRLATSGCDLKPLHTTEWLVTGDFEGCLPTIEELTEERRSAEEFDLVSEPMDRAAQLAPLTDLSSREYLVRKKVAFDLGIFIQCYLHLTAQKGSYFKKAKKSLSVIISSLQQCLNYFGISISTPIFSTADEAEKFVLGQGVRIVDLINTHMEYAESDEVSAANVLGGCVYLYSLDSRSSSPENDIRSDLRRKISELAQRLGIDEKELSPFFDNFDIKLPRDLIHQLVFGSLQNNRRVQKQRLSRVSDPRPKKDQD